LITYKATPEIISVNGIEVNIADIMDGSRRLIPDKQQRRAYCMCVVEGLTRDKEVAVNYKNEFREGKIDEIFKKMYADGDIDLSACGAYIPNSK
jgi:hypothetical protein